MESCSYKMAEPGSEDGPHQFGESGAYLAVLNLRNRLVRASCLGLQHGHETAISRICRLWDVMAKMRRPMYVTV